FPPGDARRPGETPTVGGLIPHHPPRASCRKATIQRDQYGNKQMKVMSIFGTRPEMIKMWATLKKLDELNFEHVMVHTGQNFTPELRDSLFKDLKLRKPDYELDIDTSGYGPEVADVIRKSDALMEKEKPDALLTLGDTYSGLSVLPAAHRGIKIFHME